MYNLNLILYRLSQVDSTRPDPDTLVNFLTRRADAYHLMTETHVYGMVKVKASHTRYRALGPELITVYRHLL